MTDNSAPPSSIRGGVKSDGVDAFPDRGETLNNRASAAEKG